MRKAEVIFVGDAASVVKAAREAETATAQAASGISKSHNRIASSFGGMVKSVAAFGAAFASIDGVKKAIETTATLGETTLKLHRVLGLTVQQASAWAAVAKVHEINTRSLGQAFGTLSKNAYAAQQGFDKQRTAINALGTSHADLLKKQALLTKGAGSQALAFKALGVSQADLKAGSHNFQGLLDKLGQGFERLPAGTDKAALAMKLFGRGWQTIVPMMRAGAEGMDAQLREAKRMGATLGGESVKSLEEFRLAQEKAQYGTMGLQLAIGQYLAPALTKVMGGIASLVEGFRNGTGAGGVLRDAFNHLVDAGKAVVGIITSIVGWLQKHQTVAVAVGGAVAGVTAAVVGVTLAIKAWTLAQAALDAALAVNPLVLLVGAIAAVTGAVVALELKTHFLESAWKGLKDAFNSVTSWIGGAATTAFNAVKQAAQVAIINPANVIISIWRGIPGFFAGVWSKVKSGISDAKDGIVSAMQTIAQIPINAIKAIWNTMFDMGKFIIQGLIKGIEAAASDLWNAAKGIAHGIVSFIKNPLGIFSPSRVMYDIGRNIAQGLTNGLLSSKEMIAAGLNQSLLYPIDAAIAALQAKSAQLQAIWAKQDSAAQRAQLVAGVEGAGGSSAMTGGSGGSGVFTGLRTAVGAGKGDPLAWAKAMVGHFAESTGQNTGPELDQLERQFGFHAAAWCAMFATEALVKAGAPRGILTASVASLNNMAATGANGMHFTNAPRPGELMTFGSSHVGVIEYVKNGVVHTIEGNANDPGGVARRTHGEGSGRYISVPLAAMGQKIAANIARVTKGGRLSANQMRGLLYAAGFRGKDLDTAVAIAMAESGGDPNATNRNTDGSIDRGFMQINSTHGSLSTFDPMANAKAAFSIFKSAGDSFSPWTTFTSGKFRQYLGNVGSGVGALGGNAAEIAKLKHELDALKAEALKMPTPAHGKAGDAQRLANAKERKKIALERLAIEEKIKALESGDKKSALLAKSQGNLSSAMQALQQFDLQAKRAAQLAKIDLQIKNLQQLKAFQDAVASLKDQMASLASQAAQTWRTLQEKQINALHDTTLKTIANSADAQQLAALQAQDAAAADAQQTQQLNDQLQQAIASGDVNAQKQAQDAIDAYNRQKQEQMLQDKINAAQQAADDAQQTALNGLDQQTQDYQTALQAQLDALTQNLAQRKINYAKWAQEVNAILAQYGLSVATDPTTEGTIDTGPGPAGAPKKGMGPTVGTLPKPKPVGGGWHGGSWGGHRASGGPVEPGYVYRVGEQGPEDVVFGQRGTVMTAEQTRRRARGNGPVMVVQNMHVKSMAAARAVADRIAFRASIGAA